MDEIRDKQNVTKPKKHWQRIFLLWLVAFIGIVWYFSKVNVQDIMNLVQSTESVQPKQKPVLSASDQIELDVPLIDQMEEPALYNGCEVTSLAMLLQYKGNDVTKNQLAEEIPTVPLIDEAGNYGDPNKAFVGDVYGGEEGYSVYHKPIAKLAKKHVSKNQKVVDLTGESFNNILLEVKQENPVWIITTTFFGAPETMETWETATGEVEINWSVHSVLITGFTENTVLINDPYGEKREVDRSELAASWKTMGAQAVTVKEKN